MPEPTRISTFAQPPPPPQTKSIPVPSLSFSVVDCAIVLFMGHWTTTATPVARAHSGPPPAPSLAAPPSTGSRALKSNWMMAQITFYIGHTLSSGGHSSPREELSRTSGGSKGRRIWYLLVHGRSREIQFKIILRFIIINLWIQFWTVLGTWLSHESCIGPSSEASGRNVSSAPWIMHALLSLLGLRPWTESLGPRQKEMSRASHHNSPSLSWMQY